VPNSTESVHCFKLVHSFRFLEELGGSTHPNLVRIACLNWAGLCCSKLAAELGCFRISSLAKAVSVAVG